MEKDKESGVKLILIIEDEVELTELIKSYVETRRKDYQVRIANDGAEGIKAIKEIMPDLIILDINLPKMGGIEIYRKISREGGGTQFPVLVLTARGELGDFFDNIDVEGFIGKPFDMQYLLSEIDRVIDKKRKRVIFMIEAGKKAETKDLSGELRKMGYRVVVMGGLEEVKTAMSKDNPDILLMEYDRKETEGYVFIKEVADTLPNLAEYKWRSKKHVPVIVYTYSDADHKEKSMNAGADMYLGRPDNFEDAKLAISDILERREKDRKDREFKRLLKMRADLDRKPDSTDLDYFDKK